MLNAAPSEHLADLSIEELRAYRQQLAQEEDRVSYWRRLAHARIDVLEAEAKNDGELSFEQLVRALGDTGSGQSRRALIKVRAADPLPDLPELSAIWASEVDPHDPTQIARALEQVRAAEGQLTAYRRALHERIDEATGELIIRYRDDPALALDVLPRA